jgi:hypothetical protein
LGGREIVEVVDLSLYIVLVLEVAENCFVFDRLQHPIGMLEAVKDKTILCLLDLLEAFPAEPASEVA